VTLQTSLDASLNQKINLVVEIGTGTPTFFSKRQVDSGLVIDADKVGLVHQAQLNPTTVNLTRVQTTINSTTITIFDGLEEAQVFTIFMGSDPNALIGETLKLHWGLNEDVAFDFSLYRLVNSYVIRSITKNGAAYQIRATSRVFDFRTPFFDTKGTLNTAIASGDTTILVDTATDIFQTAAITGRLRAGNDTEFEFMTYTSKSFSGGITTFTGVGRGDQSSIAKAFAIGTTFAEMKKLEENPIVLYLQLLISGSGASGAGAIYDVLHDGLAIDEDEIDIVALEAISTSTDFTGRTIRLFFYDIPNALKKLQRVLFKPFGLRPIETTDGKLSLAVLNEAVPGGLPELNNDNTLPNPIWKTTKDNIINKFNVRLAFSEGLKTFTQILPFVDATSVTDFGERKGPDIDIEGAQLDIGGLSFVTAIGTRLLTRFSTPQTTIKARSFLDTFAIDVGSDVQFVHDDVPAPGGGGLGISEAVEILDIFTSYANIRTGNISPVEPIVLVNSQLSFDVAVGEGSLYKAGYVILMRTAAGVALVDGVRTIDTVVGDTITVTVAYVTTLLVGFLTDFPDYDTPWSSEQNGEYMAIGDDSGTFSNDSTNIYKISIG